MIRKRSGFTLIELLVVIAIIAILAAILFPVFAQAKTAAKVSVAISNAKQVNLGLQLYAGDYDDTLPVRGVWNGDGNSWAQGWCSGDQLGCPSWDKVMTPYTKNFELLSVPLDRAPMTKNDKMANVKRSFRVANNALPQMGGLPGQPGGVGRGANTFSQIPEPASTILLTEQRNDLQSATWPWQPFGAWFEYWGLFTGSYNTLGNTPSNYYEGIDYSAANKAVFAFMDGSVRTRPKGFNFQGYQRRLNINNPVDNTLQGVCLDAAETQAQVANDCKIPGQ